MEFEFKITTWEKVTVNDDDLEEAVFQAIKDGEINSAGDVFNFGDAEDIQCETILEVEEQMTVEENGGCATIEIRDGRAGDIIWNNVQPIVID